MLIRTCSPCEFHDVREEEGERESYCRKENCWSQFSKCIVKKALHRYLEEEKDEGRPARAG